MGRELLGNVFSSCEYAYRSSIAPYLQNSQLLLVPPSWQNSGLVSYPLGTDDLGRDLMSRLMLGTSYTFGLAILAVFGSLIVGVILGALSGMSKGVKSSIFNHLLDFLVISILFTIFMVSHGSCHLLDVVSL